MDKNDLRNIHVLNTLIGINNNRIACCSYAAREIALPTLKDLFSRLNETSVQCRQELAHEVYKLGGRPLEATLATDDFLNAWMEVYAAFSRRDHKAILDSFCHEEGVVVRTYQEVLCDENSVPSWHQPLLHRQYEALLNDSVRLKNLRNALIKQ